MSKKDAVKHFAFVCSGKSCKKCGSKELEKSLSHAAKKHDLKGKFKVINTKCTGRCKESPVMIIKDHWHVMVKPEDGEKYLKKYILQ
ncbi:(2Fe-2S) ferredoxin domain-containing protein [Marinigracilibium pacificum]|uniref:(2Fe-2S) ferredoxin domain-containing protein n=1 Tax=Marinigracilibium pacificum TaxID=2729599 RepID=A0A848J0J2_9BACT|nr:(2Fe-2S) ferredoxin domain-containing protein [Marinigracilibium pacificum]NMM49181.1 (2Fe-2S) ferredoxin domain-containing protein [Marinigracilibium pacificum]